MANKIQLRRGTKAQLATLGALSVAEPGYCTDTKELFIGNASGGNTPLVTATSADITYYVRTDGSDSNTGLINTAGGAFKTINKAISMIPLIVNHTVTLNVAAGTYAEAVSINGFSGAGLLLINPSVTAVSTSYNVQSVIVNNCAIPVGISGINATTTSGNSFGVGSCVDVELKFCSGTTSAGSSGVYSNSGNVYLYACVFSNKARGVYSGQNSNVFTWDCSGTGNTISLYAAEGGRIATTGVIPTGTTSTATGNGGSISSGVVNPWGDNTTSIRSMTSAWSTSSQSYAANAWTKVMYSNEVFDNLGEYNPTLHRFTAAKAGMYLVSASINPQAPGINSTCTLTVWVNGARTKDFGYAQTAGASSTGFQGCAVVRLSPGDYVEIYAYANVNMVGVAGSAYQYFDVVQVA